MADNTREILNKLLVEVQAKLAKSSAGTSQRGGGPTFQINLSISRDDEQKARSQASGASRGQAGRTRESRGETYDRGDWMAQEARKGGFYSTLADLIDPVRNWQARKKDAAFGQFGHGGRMVQHYLDLMGQGSGDFAKFARGAKGALTTAGATVSAIAEDAGNVGAAFNAFVKSAEGMQAIGEGVASYFHAFGQAARNLIAEVTAPAKGFADANAVRIERQRLGQGKEDNSDLGAIYQAEREQEAGMQKIKGAIGANKSEEEWAGFAKDPGKFRQFIVEIVKREIDTQLARFMGNFRL